MSLAPTAPSGRTPGVDVLRGAALFGVLFENMQHFVSPTYVAWVARPESSGLDAWALWAVRFLCDHKIYILFSFLFGYGIALQMMRAAAARSGFATLHLWRMGILLLFGVAHSLVWMGDILVTFAVLGVLLLPLRRCSDRTLGAFAVGLILTPTLASAALAVLADGMGPAGRDSLALAVAELAYPVRQGCFAFAMFALGLAAGRRHLLADPTRCMAAMRPALPALAVLGLAGNGLVLALAKDASPLSASLAAGELAIAIGAPALAALYVYAILWAVARPRLRRRLAPLGDAGRATLTNYVVQSLIGVGILRSTGLGPLGPITPSAGIALTVAIFGIQVAASHAWLARMRFGLLEWLWRSLSYGEAQRMCPPRERG